MSNKPLTAHCQNYSLADDEPDASRPYAHPHPRMSIRSDATRPTTGVTHGDAQHAHDRTSTTDETSDVCLSACSDANESAL